MAEEAGGPEKVESGGIWQAWHRGESRCPYCIGKCPADWPRGSPPAWHRVLVPPPLAAEVAALLNDEQEATAEGFANIPEAIAALVRDRLLPDWQIAQILAMDPTLAAEVAALLKETP